MTNGSVEVLEVLKGAVTQSQRMTTFVIWEERERGVIKVSGRMEGPVVYEA